MNSPMTLNPSQRISRLLRLVRNDLLHVFREPVLAAIAVVPFLMVAVLRWGFPLLAELLPWLQDEAIIVLGVFSLMNATFAAFLISFVFLEERDQDLMPVMRTLPVSWGFFLFSRMGFLVLMAFVFCLFTILAAGIAPIPFGKACVMAGLSALTAPLYTLAVVAFANNKIEGMTWFKGLNGFLALPLLGIYFKAIWSYAFVLFPFFWTYRALHHMGDNSQFYLSVAIGIGVHLIAIMLLYRLFLKKVM